MRRCGICKRKSAVLFRSVDPACASENGSPYRSHVPRNHIPALCLQVSTKFSSAPPAALLPFYNVVPNKAPLKNFSLHNIVRSNLSTFISCLSFLVLYLTHICENLISICLLLFACYFFSFLLVDFDRVKMLESELWLCWMNREVSYSEKDCDISQLKY